MTRRRFLSVPLLTLPCAPMLRGQMASRGVKALPRGKPSGLPFHARFTDIAREAGLRAPVIYGGADRNEYILESMGCGAAFIDYDNDGWMDIVTLTGRRLTDTPDDAIIRLYRNNRDGTFTDVTAKAGIGRSVWACGITVGDYDNDGFDDVFISCWGQNLLFHNNGDGTFTERTEKAGLTHRGTRYATGCTWIDYDRDGKLDLFVSHYVDFDFDKVAPEGKNPECNWKGIPVECGPRGLGQQPHSLYHNNHDGTFTEVGLESGVALNEDGQAQAGMGLGIGDFNCDGNLDVFRTHFTEDIPVLYQGNGKGYFRDVTTVGGLGVETRFVSWGAGIVDLDNDGLPDLFFATGMVYPEIEKQFPEPPYK